jgi:hypothetical protein
MAEARKFLPSSSSSLPPAAGVHVGPRAAIPAQQEQTRK